MTTFVRDQWYVAAYGSEIGRKLLGRTILGEPLVFYRGEAGEVAALADRCVHRRFPLSESRLEGDTIVCGYHGFTYDSAGTCVFVPGQERVPRTARVPAYPVVERDSFVWVWIGEADRADESLIPRAPWLADPRYTTACGMEPLAARYLLLVDNLMDLSHETYLHGGHIGTPEVANTPITTQVDEDSGIIYVSRRMADAACPPFYAKSTGIDGRITRWQDIEYHPPCLYLLHSRIAPAGVLPHEDGSDPSGFHVEVVYAITPETEHTRLLGGGKGFRPRRPGGVGLSLAEQPHGGHAGCQRAEHPGEGDPGRAGRLPGAVDQHRHRGPGRTADPRADGRRGADDRGGDMTSVTGGTVYRIHWKLGTDVLIGVCHCGAVHESEDPVELWDWLLAHPAGHG